MHKFVSRPRARSIGTSGFHYYMNLTLTVQRSNSRSVYNGMTFTLLLCAVCFFLVGYLDFQSSGVMFVQQSWRPEGTFNIMEIMRSEDLERTSQAFLGHHRTSLCSDATTASYFRVFDGRILQKLGCLYTWKTYFANMLADFGTTPSKAILNMILLEVNFNHQLYDFGQVTSPFHIVIFSSVKCQKVSVVRFSLSMVCLLTLLCIYADPSRSSWCSHPCDESQLHRTYGNRIDTKAFFSILKYLKDPMEESSKL